MRFPFKRLPLAKATLVSGKGINVFFNDDELLLSLKVNFSRSAEYFLTIYYYIIYIYSIYLPNSIISTIDR